MAHILHGYIVTVKERRGEDQLLGNFDGAGTRLIDLMAEFLEQHRDDDWRDVPSVPMLAPPGNAHQATVEG